MNKEVITTKQAIAIMIMFMIGTALMHPIHAKANQDFWAAYLFVVIITLFVFFVYSRIISLFPQKDLLDIHTFLFGKIAGSIIYGFYVFYAFSLCVFVTRHFTEFIQAISLPETPQYAFEICIMVVGIYIAKKGIETLGRWCLFSLPIIIFIFLLTIIFSISLFDPDHLKPILQNDLFLIADNAFNSFSLPFGECVLFLLLFDSLRNSKKSKNVFYTSMAIGVIIILMAISRNIMVLGVANNSLLTSSSVGAVSIIKIKSFVERIEVIIVIIFIICGLAKITVCLMGAAKGTARLLKLNSDQPLIAPIGLLIIMLSLNCFENFIQLSKWFYVYRLLFLPIQIIFPLAAWITAEIKMKLQKKHKSIKS